MSIKHYVLCISGYSGSGKDEFASQIITDTGAPKIGLADPAKRHMADIYGFTEEQLFGPSSCRNAGDVRYLREEARSMTAEELKDATPGDPKIWLSPRETLQRYCELMNLMYGDTWVRKSLETHKIMTEVHSYFEHDCLCWEYDRMKGLISRFGDGKSLVWAPEVFFSCSADFRHWHEMILARQMTTDSFIPVLIRVKRPSIPNPPYDHRSETEMADIPDSVFDFVINNDGTVEDLHKLASMILMAIKLPEFKPRPLSSILKRIGSMKGII
jgi:hypothetical protein